MTQRQRLTLAIALVFATASVAAAGTDILLKLEGDGKLVATAPVAADGSFLFENVPDGAYYVEFVTNGKTYSTSTRPTGKAAGTGDSAEAIRVSAPRDSASGMASGRRMHKPMVITKEWGAASPKLMLSVEGSTVRGGIDTSALNVKN